MKGISERGRAAQGLTAGRGTLRGKGKCVALPLRFPAPCTTFALQKRTASAPRFGGLPPVHTIVNVRSDCLLSKEWCDTVFEGRNKDYGAYALRRQAGARYRKSLCAVLGAFALFALSFLAFALYTRYATEKEMREAADAFASLRPQRLREDYKVRFLSTARTVPPVRMAPGAVSQAPEIVEGVPPIRSIGFDGPISYDPEQDAIVTPVVDTTGFSDKSLPIAKEKIVPTEVVREMPQFPGGPKAFMQWLDQHIVYPQQCIREGKGGVVELSFIVGADGYATDFEVKNAFDPRIHRSALTAMKSLPRWKPGTGADGTPAPVKITVPVDFKAR